MLKIYLLLSAPVGQDPFAGSGQAVASRFRELVPAALGYSQTRALSEQIEPGSEPAYAGVAELWFDDAGEAFAAAADVAALAPLWGDRAAVTAVVLGHERIVMRLPEHHSVGFIKGVFPFRRKAQMAVSDFQHYWWHTHGPIAAKTEGALCYVQCHPLPACYREGAPPFDGVTELHWPSVAAARSAMASAQMRTDQAGDAPNFVEADSVMLFLAKEDRVIPA